MRNPLPSTQISAHSKQDRKPCIKPSVFHFPQLLQKTNKINLHRPLPAFPMSITPQPNPTLKPITFLPKKETKYTIPAKIQRNSARTIMNAPQLKPKLVTTRFQPTLSQIISPSEESSVYQLSEMDNHDEVIHQIQARIANRDTNIIQLAHDATTLDALDLRGMNNLQQLALFLIHQAQLQHINNLQISSVIFTVAEESLTRDDLDVQILQQLLNYINNDVHMLGQLCQFIKRSSQQIAYIRVDKLSILSEITSKIINIVWNNSEISTEQNQLIIQGLNLLLRNKIFRVKMKDTFEQDRLNSITTDFQKSVFTQFVQFKLRSS